MSKLASAFKELCGVCRPRPDLIAGGIEDAARRLWRVLGEFPEPVALQALDEWPRQSEWFPTEKELRDLLQRFGMKAALANAAAGFTDGGKSKVPVGNTVAFVEAVRQLRGHDYTCAWLSGGMNCLFTANHVLTTRIGEERLNRDVPELIADHGIKVLHDPECSIMLAKYCDDHGISSEPKRVRGRR